jgi:hypothetical protein
MSYRCADSLRAGSGWNCSSFLSLLASGQQTCMTYTIAVCDDGQRNCPKHVQFLPKNKSEKLVHLVGFIIRKFIMMHGHMNVLYLYDNCTPWFNTVNTMHAPRPSIITLSTIEV